MFKIFYPNLMSLMQNRHKLKK